MLTDWSTGLLKEASGQQTSQLASCLEHHRVQRTICMHVSRLLRGRCLFQAELNQLTSSIWRWRLCICLCSISPSLFLHLPAHIQTLGTVAAAALGEHAVGAGSLIVCWKPEKGEKQQTLPLSMSYVCSSALADESC